MSAAPRIAHEGPQLIEVGESMLPQLDELLATRGLALISNPLTNRQKLVHIPPYLQADVVERATAIAERGTEHLPRRDSAIVEPLHHHAHPRQRNQSDFRRKRGKKT